MSALLGYLLVRDENDRTICDWDGEIHNTRNGAEEGLYAAWQQEPLYQWYLAEVRRAEGGWIVSNIDQAIATVRAAGYVVLKAKSYRQAQERQRIAEALKRSAEEQQADTRDWAVGCLDEQRRLADRLTFVYGVAMAHGATQEELAGSTGFREATSKGGD